MSVTGSQVEVPTLRYEFRRLWQLGAPVALTQLGAMSLNFVDVLMVGRLGVHEFDAAALGYIWLFGTSIFALGLIMGADPILTQAHGAGDSKKIALTLQQSLVLACLVCIPVGISWYQTENVMVAFGQHPAHAAAAQGYLEVQVWTLPCFLGFQALRQYLQARGIMHPGLWVVLIANLFNLAANWALIWGHLGFPAMGLEGAGIATASTRAFLLVGLVAWILIGGLHKGVWVPWSAAAFDTKGLRHISMLGLPIAVQYGLEGWAFQISGLMAGWLGETELAAHTAVLNLASISFMLALGVSIGATTRVGNLIGMHRYAHAQRSAWLALAMGAGVMAFCGAGFVATRHLLPMMYTTDPVVIALAASILPVAAAFQVFDGAQCVGGGVLRGMGRTRPAAVFNLLAYYVISLPLGYLMAFKLDLGLVGIWLGLAIGLGIAASLFIGWINYRGPASMRTGVRAELAN
jgi:MATE family multidrug resistance protein